MNAAFAIMLRSDVGPADASAVRRLVEATGFFNAEEVEIAGELIDDRLARGEASHYRFVFADDASDRSPAGYACYGRTAGTQCSFDLYWIVVHPRHQRAGVGARLMREAERRIAAEAGGSARIYVETSSRTQYEPTRAFYRRCGYEVAGEFADFYAPGDGKITFVKVVTA